VWLIGGSKTKCRVVEDGRAVERFCKVCEAESTFRECEVTDKVHAFFVEFVETKTRRMVCAKCGDDHDVEEERSPPSQRAPAKRPARKEPSEAEVDDMLAELKRRMKR
jgi:hypothetical protein